MVKSLFVLISQLWIEREFHSFMHMEIECIAVKFCILKSAILNWDEICFDTKKASNAGRETK